MNQKLLPLVIIIFSLLSGMIGAFFMNKIDSNMVQKDIGINENSVKKEISYTNLSSLESNITDIVKKVSPSIVSIIIKQDIVLYRSDPFGFFQEPIGKANQKVGGGTGFFISKDGKILTNKHVVSGKNSEYTVITSDAKEYDAKVIATDPLSDLAIIQISSEKGFIPLTIISNEESINIGQFAIAIGNALTEFQNTVSLGLISGKDRSLSDGNINLSGLLQTDAAINPGNSGGPLVNLKGEVMGINTAILNGAEGIGFSIQLSEKKIQYILDSIEKYGEIKRPFIGINFIPLSKQAQKKLGTKTDYGAYIPSDGIVSGSNAEKSGLTSGDTILEIDGKKLQEDKNIVEEIQNKIPGEIIQMKVLKKNGETKNISLTLTEY